jgi:hypothetical protein
VANAVWPGINIPAATTRLGRTRRRLTRRSLSRSAKTLVPRYGIVLRSSHDQANTANTKQVVDGLLKAIVVVNPNSYRQTQKFDATGRIAKTLC